MQYATHNEREALEAAVFAYGWFDYEETRDTEGYVQRWRTFRKARNTRAIARTCHFPALAALPRES